MSEIAAQLRRLVRERAGSRCEYCGLSLRALHLNKRWLEIQTRDGGVVHFRTPADVLDDVVGPMVNRLVRVRSHVDVKAGRENFYVDDVEFEGA